jgi:hypothetical protein
VTPTEEAVVLAVGSTYFEVFPASLRGHVESLYAIEQPPVRTHDVVDERPRAPLSQADREFGAFLAVARLMADFRRQVDALTQE